MRSAFFVPNFCWFVIFLFGEKLRNILHKCEIVFFSQKLGTFENLKFEFINLFLFFFRLKHCSQDPSLPSNNNPFQHSIITLLKRQANCSSISLTSITSLNMSFAKGTPHGCWNHGQRSTWATSNNNKTLKKRPPKLEKQVVNLQWFDLCDYWKNNDKSYWNHEGRHSVLSLLKTMCSS